MILLIAKNTVQKGKQQEFVELALKIPDRKMAVSITIW